MSVGLNASADGLSRTTGMPAFGNWTSMAWVYRAVDQTVNESVNYLADAGFTTYFGMGVFSSPSQFFVEASTGGFNAGTTLRLFRWYHLAMVFDDTANTLTGYLDGVQDCQITGATLTFTPGQEILANLPTPSTNFINGRVTQYRAYTAILSAAEILAERNSSTPVRTANLHRNTPLANATTLTDTQGTANWTGAGTLTTDPDIVLTRTRVYTLSSGTPGVTPASWQFGTLVPGGPVSVPGSLTLNTGSAMTTKSDTIGVTNPTLQAYGRTILGPLTAQTIDGGVIGQMRGSENNLANNCTLAMAVKLVQPDGTNRSILLAPTASTTVNATTELAVALTNKQFCTGAGIIDIPLTAQTATAGDFLVIEWGLRSAQTTASRTAALSYGNDSATPLPEDVTTTAANTPWFEFSSVLTLQSGGITGTLAVTQAANTPTSTGALAIGGSMTASQGAAGLSATGSLFQAGFGIDTPLKRRSAIMVLQPAQISLPSPTVTPGTVGAADRAQTAWTYGGLMLAGASTGTVAVTQAPHVLTSTGVGPGGGIFGTATLAQDAQIGSSTATLALQGAATQSQAAHILTSAAVVGLGGTVAVAQAAQALTSTGAGPGLDTSRKRRSAIAILEPWQLAPPSPTDSPGLVDAADRAQLAWTWAGRAVLGIGTVSVTQAAQTLTSRGWFALNGAMSASQAPQALTSTIILQRWATAAISQTAQILSSSGTGPLVNGRLTIAGPQVVFLPASAHGLGTPNLLVQAYDASLPYAEQMTAAIQVTPSLGDVTVTYTQPQSGYILVSNRAQPAYTKPFSVGAGGSVSVLAAEHGRSTANLFVMVFDSAGTQIGARIRVQQTTFEVRVEFVQAQSGTVVIAPTVPIGPPINASQAFSGVHSVTFLASSHGLGTANLLPQLYDAVGNTIDAQLVVAPGTGNVTATFLQPQSGRLVVGGGGAAGILGSVSVTQSPQTTTSTGVLALQATVAALQAAQVLTSAGGTGISATAVLSQSSQALTSTSALALGATASLSQAAQTLSSTSVISLAATGTMTQVAHTLTAFGVGPGAGILGTAILSQSSQIATSTGALALQATTAVSQAPEILTSTGALAIQAQGSASQAHQTLTSTAPLAVAGAATLAQAAQTTSSTGALALAATLAKLQDPQSVTAFGVGPGAGILATVGVLQAPQTPSSTASLALQATMTASQAAQTLTSTGSFAIQAAVAVSQASETVSSTATLPLTATAAIAQANATLTSTASLALHATMGVLQTPQTAAATGGTGLLGLATLAQAAQGLSSTGAMTLSATATLAQGAQVASATAALALQATAVVAQAAHTLTSTGARTPIGGTVTAAQASQSLGSTAALALQGVMAASQAPQGEVATAALVLQATATLTQAAQALSSHGFFALEATVAVTQAAQTLSSTVTLTGLAIGITGTWEMAPAVTGEWSTSSAEAGTWAVETADALT